MGALRPVWRRIRDARSRDAYFVARFPSALLLATGYAYTAVVLAFKINVPPGSGVQRVASDFAFACAVFAIWHLLGYFGFVADGPRKIGYFVSACFLGGFSAVLYADQVMLGGGYVALGCLVALVSYWRYPRRSEQDRAHAAGR